ncbi:hypothetical protein OOT46_27935 [Aquabacterium sp. A7-Y]|uniref:hypothetical protein n=1 Tax=Aquabacterium sp. A7-Y TaxID=1349605 RepID=UPI00223CDE38|nr:hypothetical protein [Aquabacterium sp. A7-Y]MCW7541636.1 hypothetical protein [Aquabacterium sp. A7-Y]
MMNFQQACAYVRATGAQAYCYAPWVEQDGRWIGLQYCLLCESQEGDSDGVPLAMHVHRIALGAPQGQSTTMERLDEWEHSLFDGPLPSGGVDLRAFRYAACDAGCNTLGRLPLPAGAAAEREWLVHRCEPHWPTAPATAFVRPGLPALGGGEAPVVLRA